MRRQFFMKAAKSQIKGLDLATYRGVIDNAVACDEFIDYNSMSEYAHGIEDVIDDIENLLKDGYGAEVIELAEYALERVEDAMESVDDSDGHMGYILERLQEIHHTACKKVNPDVEALAERLFKWELNTDWDTFSNAVETYREVLGEKGLAVYRKLAQTHWQRVPVLGPGRDEKERYGQRFRITHIMEALARQSGDVEALVIIKKRDLSLAYAYVQIAEIYKQARKDDLALEWAEAGMKAFPERTDSRLREFLAEEYHHRKRHDEAMALMWKGFVESPCLAQYQTLKTHADRINQWTIWREKALAIIREMIAKAKKEAVKDRLGWIGRTDHSELVKVFLWEKDVEAAWREAKEGGCSNELWLELTKKREKNYPQDALEIYQSQVEPTLEQKNNQAYEQAIGFLRKVFELMTRIGRGDDFKPYIDSFRLKHKSKRNFIKFLDRRKW